MIWKILMLIIKLTVIEIVINTMFTYPWKNGPKAHGWQFTGEVNCPFSRQFSQTEAHTHQSVLWDFKSVVHSLDVNDRIWVKSVSFVVKYDTETGPWWHRKALTHWPPCFGGMVLLWSPERASWIWTYTQFGLIARRSQCLFYTVSRGKMEVNAAGLHAMWIAWFSWVGLQQYMVTIEKKCVCHCTYRTKNERRFYFLTRPSHMVTGNITAIKCNSTRSVI